MKQMKISKLKLKSQSNGNNNNNLTQLLQFRTIIASTRKLRTRKMPVASALARATASQAAESRAQNLNELQQLRSEAEAARVAASAAVHPKQVFPDSLIPDW